MLKIFTIQYFVLLIYIIKCFIIILFVIYGSKMEESKKVYFYNIDFLRILFCMLIILRHILNSAISSPVVINSNIFSYLIYNSKFLDISVDFFFVISGFFLFYATDFSKNICEFALKKLIRLLPVVIFALVLWYICAFFLNEIPNIYDDIWTLFLMQNIGLTFNPSSIGGTWYVSVLFWCSLFIFYAYKSLQKNHFNLIMATLCVLSYSFYLHSNIPNHSNFAYIFNQGVIRGIGGLLLGYFIYNFYVGILKNFRIKPPKPFEKKCLYFF